MREHIAWSMQSCQGTINEPRQLHLVGNFRNYIMMYGTVYVKPNHVAGNVKKKYSLQINLHWIVGGGGKGWVGGEVLLIQSRKQNFYATYQDEIHFNNFFSFEKWIFNSSSAYCFWKLYAVYKSCHFILSWGRWAHCTALRNVLWC
jgi:hypothetical protein